MPTITPTWTASSLVAITTVARNAVSRSTLDLRTKWGAYVYVSLGRGGTNGLTNGVDVVCYRTYNNVAEEHPGALVAVRSLAAAAVSTTCASSGNNAGSTSLTVASTASFAAGDIICIQDAATPTGLTEWNRVAQVTSATVLLLTHPTLNAHNNTAHTCRNKGDSWQFWLEGGSTWEIVVDYGDDSAGDTVTLQIDYESLDSVGSV